MPARRAPRVTGNGGRAPAAMVGGVKPRAPRAAGNDGGAPAATMAPPLLLFISDLAGLGSCCCLRCIILACIPLQSARSRPS